MPATGFTKQDLNASVFGSITVSPFVLLLDTGKKLLLEDGIGAILIGSSGLKATGFTPETLTATGYTDS